MVELRNVSKRFADFLAVDDVSLTVNPGEFLTLLGPSGCGKTTMLRMISGLETPSNGRVFLENADVTHVPPYRRDVNQVFQSYALFPHMTVERNIAFGLKMHRIPRAERQNRTARAIELVALAGLENRLPSELSGGQKQRVALARAIVCEPRVLLLDEPLSALDAKLRRAMQVELKHLQKRLGITFIFVTHDQEEAMTMSDRIAVINKGKIEQLGTPRDIYHRPATSFVARFIGDANLLEGTITTRVIDSVRVKLNSGTELLLTDPAPLQNKDAVLLSIRPERIRLQTQSENNPNSFPAEILEEIFAGPSRQVRIRLNGGEELSILISGDATPFSPGQKLFCHIDPAVPVIISSP